MTEPLLSVRDLTVTFRSGPPWRRRHIQAVRGVSFDIQAGRTLGLVGESGSGKSTTGKAIARLLPLTGGDVTFDGTPVAGLAGTALTEWRREVGFIFQDPYGSLNSRMSVAEIITEPLRVHGIGSPAERERAALELIDDVELPQSALSKYPHEFSGGQRQRIAIARALALKPRLIIADEPVSALDVSVQAAVLNLFKDLQDKYDLAYLFISHDLDVVEYMSDDIAVMYLGGIVEFGPAGEVFARPSHPYTTALLSSAPSIDAPATDPSTRLHGEIPSADNPPTGCPFHTRCPRAEEICFDVIPPVRFSGEHRAACHFADPGGVGVVDASTRGHLSAPTVPEDRHDR